MRRSIIQVLFAQGIVLVASILKSLILPVVLDVEGFAYWQVYVLYSGFVGVFALGYSDGIYLKYGGCDYGDLPFERLRASVKVYLLSLLVFSFAICSLSLLDPDSNHGFALFFVGIDVLLACLSGLLLYVLQITNQIKSYSFYVTVDKIMMILLIGIIMFSFPAPNFRLIIISDCFTKVFVCIALVFRCRRIFFGATTSLFYGIQDYLKEARVGFSLLVANLTGMLAVNAGRFIVEIMGSTADYAYYSFGVSVTNLVLTFVSAAALVLYPNIKRMDPDRVRSFFDELDVASIKVVNIGFMLYAPCVLFVIFFIPKYEPMLDYLGFMFLAVAGQTKMQFLGNTYYKALRKERRMLSVNMQAVVIFLIVGGASYLLLNSVTAIAASTAFVLLYRAWASECELRRELGISKDSKVVVEIAFCIVFVASTLVPIRELSLLLTEVVGMVGLVSVFVYCRRIS